MEFWVEVMKDAVVGGKGRWEMWEEGMDGGWKLEGGGKELRGEDGGREGVLGVGSEVRNEGRGKEKW